MARYLNDQAKVVLLAESGTYGVSSGAGIWPGQVQSHSITEKENVIQTRFLGQGNRNVGQFNPGPTDIEGTLTFYPQDWMMLGYTLGSIQKVSGTNNTYVLSEVDGGERFSAFTSGTLNPFISFTVEESRTGPTANQNFMRTIKGCNVNSYTVSITQGEPVEVEVGFLAQSGSWFSGASSSVSTGSTRPYLWSDALIGLPDSTTQEAVKELTFSINNNFEGPHYINGSRVIAVPYPLNRDYLVEVKQDLDSTVCGSLYNTYFKGGSEFNATLNINASATGGVNTGSHQLIVTFSGCKMITMEVPVNVGGISETSYTFIPGSVIATAYDRVTSYAPF